MTIGESTAQPETARDEAEGLTIPEVLRLLSAGAAGAILMALGPGSLRTKELTERVRGYTPRTVYRYSSKLAASGVIERDEQPGVPSKVVHSLTKPRGRELHDLVEAYAAASLTRLPNGEIDAHAWGSLALLADLWEAGMIGELNSGPRSPTELSRGSHGLSYHQVSRRASLFAIGGFIQELVDAGPRRRYALTEKARRAMALVLGIGRWRQRNLVEDGELGMTATEVAIALQTALPLVALPEYAGKCFGVEIADEEVWASVQPDGALLVCEPVAAGGDGHGRGKVRAWLDALVTGSPRGVRADGDGALIGTLLSRLHRVLWTSVEPGWRPPSAEAEPQS
ncbi:MAG: winged helix-turn-helix transcriptional regulator [Solirubrobacterales bacterium]